MKSTDFNRAVTSQKLKENFFKQFGSQVDLDKYSREQLEDIRNQFRTRVFQHENQAGYNELLTNETYQKDKAILQLLNTRIKEMLGEDIKKLKDKLVAIEEAKKGVKAPKYAKHSKGTGDDKTGDGRKDFDDIQVARMVAGGVPKDKAIAKATSDKFKEDSVSERFVKGKSYGSQPETDSDDDDTPAPAEKKAKKAPITHREKMPGEDDALAAHKRMSKGATKVKGSAQSGPQKESMEKCNHTPEGKKCPVHGMKECGTMEAKEKPSAGLSKKEKSAVVKKAKKGGDIGKPGKGFAKVEKAAKAGGAKDPKAVAAAAMWKNVKRESQEAFRKNVRIVNESLAYLLAEDEEGKAKAITAAGDMVNDFTSWMQRVGQYQTKTMIELADAIKADFGPAEAETFKQAVGPALAATLEILTQQREAISNAVAVLAGEAAPTEPMGAEPMEPSVEPSEPDMMNEPGDEFAASDAAAGGDTTSGREMRESQFSRKLAESHSIIAKLAK